MPSCTKHSTQIDKLERSEKNMQIWLSLKCILGLFLWLDYYIEFLHCDQEWQNNPNLTLQAKLEHIVDEFEAGFLSLAKTKTFSNLFIMKL